MAFAGGWVYGGVLAVPDTLLDTAGGKAFYALAFSRSRDLNSFLNSLSSLW